MVPIITKWKGLWKPRELAPDWWNRSIYRSLKNSRMGKITHSTDTIRDCVRDFTWLRGAVVGNEVVLEWIGNHVDLRNKIAWVSRRWKHTNWKRYRNVWNERLNIYASSALLVEYESCKTVFRKMGRMRLGAQKRLVMVNRSRAMTCWINGRWGGTAGAKSILGWSGPKRKCGLSYYVGSQEWSRIS